MPATSRLSMPKSTYVIAAMAVVLSVALATPGLSTPATSAYAINNAQDDKNNRTVPGCGVTYPDCNSDQGFSKHIENCERHESGEVGNGENLPGQCYNSP